jgi:hypothetical protein
MAWACEVSDHGVEYVIKCLIVIAKTLKMTGIKIAKMLFTSCKLENLNNI